MNHNCNGCSLDSLFVKEVIIAYCGESTAVEIIKPPIVDEEVVIPVPPPIRLNYIKFDNTTTLNSSLGDVAGIVFSRNGGPLQEKLFIMEPGLDYSLYNFFNDFDIYDPDTQHSFSYLGDGIPHIEDIITPSRLDGDKLYMWGYNYDIFMQDVGQLAYNFPTDIYDMPVSFTFYPASSLDAHHISYDIFDHIVDPDLYDSNENSHFSERGIAPAIRNPDGSITIKSELMVKFPVPEVPVIREDLRDVRTGEVMANAINLQCTNPAYNTAANAYKAWCIDAGLSSTASLPGIDSQDDAAFTLDLGFSPLIGGVTNKMTMSSEGGFAIYRQEWESNGNEHTSIAVPYNSDGMARLDRFYLRTTAMPALIISAKIPGSDYRNMNSKWQKTSNAAFFYVEYSHYSGANGLVKMALKLEEGGHIEVVLSEADTDNIKLQFLTLDESTYASNHEAAVGYGGYGVPVLFGQTAVYSNNLVAACEPGWVIPTVPSVFDATYPGMGFKPPEPLIVGPWRLHNVTVKYDYYLFNFVGISEEYSSVYAFSPDVLRYMHEIGDYSALDEVLAYKNYTSWSWGEDNATIKASYILYGKEEHVEYDPSIFIGMVKEAAFTTKLPVCMATYEAAGLAQISGQSNLMSALPYWSKPLELPIVETREQGSPNFYSR